MSIFGYKYIQTQELTAARQDIITKDAELNNKVLTDIIIAKYSLYI